MIEQPSPPTISYAGPGKRLGGFVIDLLILTLLALVLIPLTGVRLDDPDTLGSTSTFRFANLAMVGIYQVAFIATRGQTPGKMLVSTKVVDAVTYQLPSLTGAVMRFVVPSAAAFIPVGGGLLTMLVYAWLLWDPRRQGLHDTAANTVVIDV
jgi:uncharacterized RDD family membrane protein YckC